MFWKSYVKTSVVRRYSWVIRNGIRDLNQEELTEAEAVLDILRGWLDTEKDRRKKAAA